MTNDLKNFLELEKEDFKKQREDISYWVEDHDIRLINFVLNQVKTEVEKKERTINNFMLNDLRDIEYNKALSEISTIIDNLRINLR